VPPKPRRRGSPCPGCDTNLPGSDRVSTSPRECPWCAQNLLPVFVAGFWRRSLARIVDGTLLLSTAGSLSYGIHTVAPGPRLYGDALGIDAILLLLERDLAEVLSPLIPFICMVGLYYLLFHAISGSTPGQRLLGLRVIDRHGCNPGVVRSILRVATAGAGTLAGGLGPLWTLFDLEKRSLHDHLAGTYVIHDRISAQDPRPPLDRPDAPPPVTDEKS